MHKFVPVLALIATVPIWIDVPVAAELHSAAPLSSPFAIDVAGAGAAVVLVAGKGGGTGGGATTGGMSGGATTGGMGGLPPPAGWVVVPRPVEWVVVPRPAEWVVVPRPAAACLMARRTLGRTAAATGPGVTRSPRTTPTNAPPRPADAPLSRQPGFARARSAPVRVAPVQTG